MHFTNIQEHLFYRTSPQAASEFHIFNFHIRFRAKVNLKQDTFQFMTKKYVTWISNRRGTFLFLGDFAKLTGNH